MKPNASAANIYRGYIGNDPKPVYVVMWEEDEESKYPLKYDRQFTTVDAALSLIRQILTTTVDISTGAT